VSYEKTIHSVKEQYGMSVVTTDCGEEIQGTTNLDAFTTLGGSSPNCLRCLAVREGHPMSQGLTDKEQLLLGLYERTIQTFIKTGDRMVFGRLEGMQDAAQTLGNDLLVNAMVALTQRNHDAMAKQTVAK